MVPNCLENSAQVLEPIMPSADVEEAGASSAAKDLHSRQRIRFRRL